MNITTPEACDMCGTIHVAGEHEDCRVRRLIAAKDAEIAALRQEIATGNGRYHRDYAAECDALLAAKDKVIAALRERCGRLANEVMVTREWNKMRNAKRGTGVLSDWQRRLSRARESVNAHNDLAPAAGEAPQEKTDVIDG